MIDLYYWPTPNGHKITMFLEETGSPYRIMPVNISTGEQFKPDFLKISPNNRMPAIVDHEPAGRAGAAVGVRIGRHPAYISQKRPAGSCPTERGAEIRRPAMAVLADGRARPDGRAESPFREYAPEKIPYAIDRYVNETNRLYGVLNDRGWNDRRLCRRRLIPSPTWPAIHWIVPARPGQDLDDFPNLQRWFETIRDRPAVMRAYEIGPRLRPETAQSSEDKKVLFGRRRRRTRGAAARRSRLDEPQPDQPSDDEIERDNVVEQARDDQDQHARGDGETRLRNPGW